jgi:fatty acid desaturase
MSDEENKPTDMRKYRRQSERQLVLLVIAFLVLVGGALIGLVYGWMAVFSALPCLLGGAAIIGGLFLFLELAERWVE